MYINPHANVLMNDFCKLNRSHSPFDEKAPSNCEKESIKTHSCCYCLLNTNYFPLEITEDETFE